MPHRFGSVQDARTLCGDLFSWYNTEHYHSAIGLMTLETVHYGRGEQIWEQRQREPDDIATGRDTLAAVH